MIDFEGGAIPEEYQAEYVVDRDRNHRHGLDRPYMGCARCHTTNTIRIPKRTSTVSRPFSIAFPKRGSTATPETLSRLQMPHPEQTSMKDTILKAIKAKDADIAASEAAWEQRERELPVSDVTAGLKDEYTFDNSLSNSLHPDVTATIVKGDLTYSDGRLGRAADSTRSLTFPRRTRFVLTREAFHRVTLAQTGWTSGMQDLQRFAKSPKEGAGYEIALDYCHKTGCNVIVRLRDAGPDSGIRSRRKKG